MKILKVCIILVFLSALGFIVYRSWNKNETAEYKTVNLYKRNIYDAIYIPGNVFPSKEIEIKSQLSGILDSVYVKIGDYIEAGAPIASIKLVPNASDIERLENNLNVARIDYDARLTEYTMEKRLFEANIIAKAEMDEYTKAYRLAKENLISAQNQLDILKQGRVVSKNISNIVHASTVGTVIDIPCETGVSVIERNNYNPGTTIAVVAEIGFFKFKTLIAEHYLKYLVLGDSVNLTFNAYQNLKTKAVVTKISSKGSSENGIMKYLLDADFEITEDMPVLRSGYSASAEIVLNSRKNVLSVEEKHIIYRNDSTYLHLLDKTGKEVLTKNVRLGISDGVYTEIIDGINDGEIVIIE